MKIFISGNNQRVWELQKIISAEHDIFIEEGKSSIPDLTAFNLIIDLNLDDNPQHLTRYALLKGIIVMGCAVKKTLKSMVAETNSELLCVLAGINSLPTFIARNVLEISFLKKEDEALIAEKIKALGLSYLAVADQVGMVTPRIICTIINEAFYTLNNGIASIEDIDKGLKLGTAYPMGPFEWANKIGIKDVYETLDAIYQSTHDARYTICPLLKEKYTTKENHVGAGI